MRARAAILLGVVWWTACFQQQGLPPLDLTTQLTQVQARSAQAERLLETVDSELEAVRSDHAAFRAIPQQTWTGDFPTDVYRHTCMACLIQPRNADVVPGSPEMLAAEEAAVGCAVLPLPALLEALRRSSGREEALAGLRAVDQMREKRSIVESRLRSLPREISDMREDIATQRAESRRVEQELERKRPEYSSSDFQTSKARVTAWRDDLDRLEASVHALDERRVAWTQAMESELAEIYRYIATLGEP